MLIRYSIVIPAHNEADHIGPFVDQFLRDLPGPVRAVLAEVILVENGSRDATLEECHRLAARSGGLVRVFSNPRGSYGEAIRRGILESRGSHLSILECDVLDGAFVEASLALFREHGARFIVGSKRHPASVDRRPLQRRLLTRGFNFLLRTCLGYPGSDTHGLKSLEAGLAKELCRLAQTSDEIFQTEIVLIAWRLGQEILELPVEIRERRATPVAVARRVPAVLHLISALRQSCSRFPAGRRRGAARQVNPQAGLRRGTGSVPSAAGSGTRTSAS
jgi:glycosyltransferase involved in cell wall biosynthesis